MKKPSLKKLKKRLKERIHESNQAIKKDLKKRVNKKTVKQAAKRAAYNLANEPLFPEVNLTVNPSKMFFNGLMTTKELKKKKKASNKQ